MTEKQKSKSSAGVIPSSEIRSAFAGAAVFSNRFVVTTNPAGVRIGFMEDDGQGWDLHHRASVLLSYSDAIALSQLLQKMLGDVAKQIEEATLAAANAPKNQGPPDA